MTLSTISLLAKKAVATVITGTIVVFGGGLVLASVQPETEVVTDDGIETLADKLEAQSAVNDALDELEPEDGWTNHGEAVSTAARELCETGADKADDATEDAETTEDEYANHGECVRDVAKSDVGKPEGAPADESGSELDAEDEDPGAGRPDHAGKPEGKGKP